MSQTFQDRFVNSGDDRPIAETPFVDPRSFVAEQSNEGWSGEVIGEGGAGSFETATPFAAGEWTEAGEQEQASPEVAALAELATEMKDSEFREALENLADEALDLHTEQLSGEYGDREMRDAAADRLLMEHFEPLAVQTEAMLDRLQERLEAYEPGALTEMEFDRVAGEVMPSGMAITPAAEQFLGGLLRKVGKIVTAPIKLAAKGLSLATRLALGPLFGPLKKLARKMLGYVVKFATNHLPAKFQPLARKLSDKLFHELNEAHDGEAMEQGPGEAEAIPAAPDVARLEAEFDLHAAQLLNTPDEAEADHLVAGFGETFERNDEAPLAALDRARADLASGLARLQPGESAQPVMEQFVPVVIAALWPALKAAIALAGRNNIVKMLGNWIGTLVRPVLGADASKLIGAPIASAGMRLFGFEAAQADPRALANEALAATVEETLTRLGEMPAHILDNETLLQSAVQEAFEEAAAANFPSAIIRPELREAADQDGTWRRLPEGTSRKRYGKYTATPDVMVTPRAAATVHSFDGTTLHDHIHDRMHVPPGQTLKTKVRLYQALPGTRIGDIARAERIPAHHLHPLTQHAAGVLLGRNAGLAPAHPASPAHPPGSRHHLHLRQRLYYLEPPSGRQHVHNRDHVRLARSELMINLRAGEIRVWLYLNERLCQQVAMELAKAHNEGAAFRLLQPLLRRPAHAMRSVMLHRHLPLSLRVVEEAPRFDNQVPPWLTQLSGQLAGKLEEWLGRQVLQYIAHNAEEFRRLSAAHHEGVTLRVAMTRVPGMETMRQVARGRVPKHIEGTAWLQGAPAFAVHATAGYAIR